VKNELILSKLFTVQVEQRMSIISPMPFAKKAAVNTTSSESEENGKF